MIEIEWQAVPPQKNASDNKPQLYPRITNAEVIDAEKLAKIMSEHSGMTKGAVSGMLEDLSEVFATLLREGKEISLPRLGRFRLSIGCDTVITPDTKNGTRYVRMRGVNFQPSDALLESIGNPTFRQVARNATTVAASAAELVPLLEVFMQSHSSFTSTEFAQHFHLKRSTASARLNELIKMGVIRREGCNKATRYVKK